MEWTGLPKVALKPTVVKPSAGLVRGSAAYAPAALYAGIRVKPNVSQKAPNVPKTTNGKVLPIIHWAGLASFSHCHHVVLIAYLAN